MKQGFIHKCSIASQLLISCLQLSTDLAADSNFRNIPAAQLQQSYTWYDGDIKREVWVNPQLIAEFNPTISQKNQISAAVTGAQVVSAKMGPVRFWQVNDTINAKTAISSISKRMNSNQISAVLHDGASTLSAMRAIPGNIIIYLDPGWDQATATQWLAQKNLQVVSQRQFMPNVFVIKSIPGLESLLMANKLYESGEVVAAFPNWWKELVTK